MEKHTSKFTTGSPDRSGFSCAMVLTAYSALSPVTGLFCHRRRPRCARHHRPTWYQRRDIGTTRLCRTQQPHSPVEVAASIASRAPRSWRRVTPLLTSARRADSYGWF